MIITESALYEDVNRGAIEIPYGIHIFKAGHCLKVHNVPVKLAPPISTRDHEIGQNTSTREFLKYFVVSRCSETSRTTNKTKCKFYLHAGILLNTQQIISLLLKVNMSLSCLIDIFLSERNVTQFVDFRSVFSQKRSQTCGVFTLPVTER